MKKVYFLKRIENLKASKAYHDYWFWYNKEHPEDARDELDIIRRKIVGHVILSRKIIIFCIMEYLILVFLIGLL
jgi:hypothetical protein